MKTIVTLTFIFFWSNIFSQYTVTGKITDLKTNNPIQAASIYINNSSIGTSSNSDGSFTISGISMDRFDLIFSCIGYVTVSKQVQIFENTIIIDIALAKKNNLLEAVVINPIEKNGWEKWGKLFFSYIIGHSKSASFCTIKNFKAVKFRFNKQENILTAFADEPLLIINKYLGYELKFDLQFFEIDFRKNTIIYVGFPFFKNLTASTKKEYKWEEQKKIVYQGSVMHFMRSIYLNKIYETGFEVRVLKRFANLEKQRVVNKTKQNNHLTVISMDDSTMYYGKIISQPDSLDYVYPNIIEADSFSYRVDSLTIGIAFTNHLQVKYKKVKTATPLATTNSNLHNTNYLPVSIITLFNASEIMVLSNGSYFNPLNLFFEGYWGHSEKLSSLLPVDYVFEE